MPRQEFHLNIAGARLRVYRFQPEEGTGPDSLVFLHDALGSIGQWRDFPPTLAQRCNREAIVFDRRGHGASSPLPGPRRPDYLHREALDFLPALLEALQIERPVLIGHSDGGTIALIYAAHHHPAAVITLAAHVIVESITLAGIRAALPHRQELTGRLQRYHGGKTEALFDAWAHTWLDPDFRNWSITGLLPDIRCPLLAIQGKDDEYGSERQVTLIADNVSGPCRTLLIDACGHTPHREKPEIVNAAIEQFLLEIE